MGATLQPDFNAQAYYTKQADGTSQFYSSFGENAELPSFIWTFTDVAVD